MYQLTAGAPEDSAFRGRERNNAQRMRAQSHWNLLQFGERWQRFEIVCSINPRVVLTVVRNKSLYPTS